jgi:hypothetical protein
MVARKGLKGKPAGLYTTLAPLWKRKSVVTSAGNTQPKKYEPTRPKDSNVALLAGSRRSPIASTTGIKRDVDVVVG